MKTGAVVVLDNIRSVYNVGSIFRTANALGIEKIYLCGITPTPLDKRGDKRKDFAKVALGAEDTVAWEYIDATTICLEKLKKERVYIVALEQDERSVDYKTVVVPENKNICFVVGAEVEGMSKESLTLCDVIAEIPMVGTKESLNVTIAFGVAAYRILGI